MAKKTRIKPKTEAQLHGELFDGFGLHVRSVTRRHEESLGSIIRVSYSVEVDCIQDPGVDDRGVPNIFMNWKVINKELDALREENSKLKDDLWAAVQQMGIDIERLKEK